MAFLERIVSTAETNLFRDDANLHGLGLFRRYTLERSPESSLSKDWARARPERAEFGIGELRGHMRVHESLQAAIS